ncbi:MAG TPA: DUF1259 domain-containing protein [Terriglobales bacterium]|nr:DUF1259 domain-containing protein [Terriglobales bacterium]
MSAITLRRFGVCTFASTLMLALFTCFSGAQTMPAVSQASASDWKTVEDALGRSGQMQPGDVFKVSFPRADLHVTLDGIDIKPGLALGGWVAFKQFGNETMAMGDLVLAEDEVEPVMMSLQQNGIQQTALHNHLIRESPHVMYMHIEGHGDPAKLAKAIHDAMALTKTPAASSAPTDVHSNLGFDQSKVESIIGHTGKVNGGILQIGVPRSESVVDSGMTIPPSMGLATSLNLQPTGGGKAAVTGDFVLLGTEVNPVIKTLREHGIAVTAIHSHMLTEEPRLFFMHFWANDDALNLANGLKAALDKTNSKK